MYIGKTKILMHNVHTGKTEKIEHGNVFKGDNIQKYLRTFGLYVNKFTTATIPLWQEVVGGIMLFDSEIPTTSNIIPAGHKMTANGAYNILNSSDPVELGSWNDTESSVSEEGDTITLVYDWTTSQGNGDIACVGLTSYTAGYIGIGNPSGTYKNVGSFGLASRRSITANNLNGAKVCHNKRISISSFSGNTLTLSVTDIWSQHAVLSNASYSKVITLSEKPVTISVAQLCQMSDTVLALVQSAGNIAPGGSVYIDVINTETWAVTSKVIINSTANGLSIGNTITPISDHELIIQNTTTRDHYIMDINAGTFQTFGAEYTGSNPTGAGLKINDNLILLPGSWTSVGTHCVLDRVNHTIYPVNMSSISTNMAFPALYDDSVGGIIVSNAGYITNNPYFLATINNLEDTVTKDVSKTMKVIYTLQKAS